MTSSSMSNTARRTDSPYLQNVVSYTHTTPEWYDTQFEYQVQYLGLTSIRHNDLRVVCLSVCRRALYMHACMRISLLACGHHRRVFASCSKE